MGLNTTMRSVLHNAIIALRSNATDIGVGEGGGVQVLCCLIKYSSAHSFRYKNINTMVIERKRFLENETGVNILS